MMYSKLDKALDYAMAAMLMTLLLMLSVGFLLVTADFIRSFFTEVL